MNKLPFVSSGNLFRVTHRCRGSRDRIPRSPVHKFNAPRKFHVIAHALQCQVVQLRAVHCHSSSIIYSFAMPSIRVSHIGIAKNKMWSEDLLILRETRNRKRDTCGIIIRVAKEFYLSNKRIWIYIYNHRHMLLFTISFCDVICLVSMMTTHADDILFPRYYIRFLIFCFQLQIRIILLMLNNLSHGRRHWIMIIASWR